MKMKLIFNNVFWVILIVTSIYGCQNRPENNSKCSCLSVGHGHRENNTDDNEYVTFQNPKRNFEIQLTFQGKEKDCIIYKYAIYKITANSNVGGMYDPSTIAKVNCKKGEIEFFKSKRYKGRSYGTYEENIFSWRAYGVYKIDKKSNLHAIGYRNSEQFKDLSHVESY